MNPSLKFSTLVALAAAWLGYFSPWVWPLPAALRLSAHDLVEWLTFMQTVRDGTFPVSRLDLLWPLAGIVIITAFVPAIFAMPPNAGYLKQLLRPAHIICLLLAGFAAYLILPAYPFILTAYNDPELAPQFWLGIGSGIAAILIYLLTPILPHRLPVTLIALIALGCLIASLRLSGIITPPIADMIVKPVELGYGFRLAVAGFAGSGVTTGIHLLNTFKKPQI